MWVTSVNYKIYDNVHEVLAEPGSLVETSDGRQRFDCEKKEESDDVSQIYDYELEGLEKWRNSQPMIGLISGPQVFITNIERSWNDT